MSDAAMETIEDMSAENTRQRHRIVALEAENARLRECERIYEGALVTLEENERAGFHTFGAASDALLLATARRSAELEEEDEQLNAPCECALCVAARRVLVGEEASRAARVGQEETIARVHFSPDMKEVHGERVPLPDDERCGGRYPVPATSPPREEPAEAEISYRCGKPTGHSGPHGGRVGSPEGEA